MLNQVTSVPSSNNFICSLPHVKDRTSIFPDVQKPEIVMDWLLFSNDPCCIWSVIAASEGTQHPTTYIFSASSSKSGAGEVALTVKGLPCKKKT